MEIRINIEFTAGMNNPAYIDFKEKYAMYLEHALEDHFPVIVGECSIWKELGED